MRKSQIKNEVPPRLVGPPPEFVGPPRPPKTIFAKLGHGDDTVPIVEISEEYRDSIGRGHLIRRVYDTIQVNGSRGNIQFLADIERRVDDWVRMLEQRYWEDFIPSEDAFGGRGGLVVYSQFPYKFKSWEEFLAADPPMGLGDRDGSHLKRLLETLSEPLRKKIRDAINKVARENLEAIGPVGGDRKSEEYRDSKLAETRTLPANGGDRNSDQDSKTENRNLISGGTNSAYRIARLKRDHPELAERIMAGEFKSVSEAERAAGLRPPKATDLEKFQRAYFRLSIADQVSAKDWLKSL